MSLVVGCAAPGGGESDGGVLASSISELAEQQIAQGGLSEWDLAALEKARETGEVSQADYEEGADLFEACLWDAGQEFTRRTLLNGVVEFQAPQVPTTDDESHEQARAQEHCYRSTYGVTQELFRLQQANPDLLTDFTLATVNCLKEAGVVGDEFTKEDFDRAMAPRTAPGEARPFDVMGPEAQTCLYSLGYAIAVDGEGAQ